jgi:hypothetical protein
MRPAFGGTPKAGLLYAKHTLATRYSKLATYS